MDFILHIVGAIGQVDWGAETTERMVSSFESLATVLAMLIGGIWVYILFFHRRSHRPRADLVIKSEHCLLDDGKRLLHVSVCLANKGETIMKLDHMFVRISKVLPTPDS